MLVHGRKLLRSSQLTRKVIVLIIISKPWLGGGVPGGGVTKNTPPACVKLSKNKFKILHFFL